MPWMDQSNRENNDFWHGFFFGGAIVMTIWLIILLGLNWRDNYKADQAKIDVQVIEAEALDGQPHPCSTTFEVLTCYYLNKRHYEVLGQNPSEFGGNQSFIQKQSCRLSRTLPQTNRYDAYRGFIRIVPPIDEYDCKQFGNVFLYNLRQIDFPK
jgi:hypothetical protein